jgi:hypothetical protein
MLDFQNYVLGIMSKSPSRRVIRLQGKLKLTGKEKKYYIYSYVLLYFSMFPCTTQSADFSDRFRRKLRKTLMSLCLPRLRLLIFALRGAGGVGSPAASPPLPPWLRQCHHFSRLSVKSQLGKYIYVWSTLTIRNLYIVVRLVFFGCRYCVRQTFAFSWTN